MEQKPNDLDDVTWPTAQECLLANAELLRPIATVCRGNPFERFVQPLIVLRLKTRPSSALVQSDLLWGFPGEKEISQCAPGIQIAACIGHSVAFAQFRRCKTPRQTLRRDDFSP